MVDVEEMNMTSFYLELKFMLNKTYSKFIFCLPIKKSCPVTYFDNSKAEKT